MAYKRGIDVSHWEPQVNFVEVAAAGYEFMFAKASQGTVTDDKFADFWRDAKGLLDRGAYHFYDPRFATITPEVQAQKFWSLLEADPGELSPVVDIERYIAGPYHGADYWYRFIQRFHTISGKWPMIYTAYYYWTDNVKISPVADYTWFSRNCQLWIANYGVSAPLIPKPWTDWTYWQYSESGIVPGVYNEYGKLTECDLNYYKETTPIPQPEEPMYLKANTTVNIRSSAEISPTNDLGAFNLLPGDIIESSATKTGSNLLWNNILKIWRNNVPVPMASSPTGEYWAASQYLVPVAFTPPTAGSGEDYIIHHINGEERRYERKP